ncbi:MAG: hypothetical protein J2P35_20015 [Actinobacteria bacterium]|nr:hypothetical protein [Actinomycetota bacterium]
MSERRRIEGLTGTQVAASALATMTSAIVASYLGIAGTIIGAAIASAATTAGTAVYRHYLGRTQQRLRAATSGLVPKVAAHTHLSHVPAQLDPVRAEASRVPGRAGAAAAAAETQPNSRAGIDPVRAAAGRGESREIGRFEPGGTTAAPGQAAQAAPPGPPGETEPAGEAGTAGETRTPGETAAGETEPAGEAGTPGETVTPGEPGTTATQPATPGPPTEPAAEDDAAPHGWAGRKRWLVLAGTAVGVFLVVMAIITLVESATGKPLDAVVWQRHGSGTTLGDTVTGSSSHPHRSPSPARTSPATPGPSSPSPAPARTSPTPVPSASPSASPSPSGTTSAPQSPVPAASSPAP